MKIFEGKSPAERNKIIAAGVTCAMALFAIAYNIVGLYPSRKTTTVSITASPTPTALPRANSETVAMPSKEDINIDYMTTPVVYNPNLFYAADAGRNIFAFYEPPPPTPYVAPIPVLKTPEPIKPPPPTPTPPFFVGYVTPQNIYAGAKTLRMEVNGDKFTPDSLIFLNDSQLPTTFVSPQKLVADIPSNMVAGAGSLQIIVRTPDGRLYSNPVILNVQAPPRPQFQYIGMIARKRFNNDTAYFQEQGKNLPTGARLNDVVGGRFRIASISSSEVVLEDVNLGFRHKLALYRPAPGQSASSGGDPNVGNPGDGSYIPFNPGTYVPPQSEIPGIPSNIPRYVPPQPQPQQPQPKTRGTKVVTNDDEDDDGDN